MDFQKYYNKDYSELSIIGQFDAAADIFWAMHADYQHRIKNNKVIPFEDYKKLTQLMVERYESVDYSIDLKTSMQAAAMKSAELILEDPQFFDTYRRWNKLRKRDYQEFSRAMQAHMNEAFSIQRRWGDIKRETHFEMIYKPSYKDKFSGEEILLMASFSNAGFRVGNGFERCLKPTQSEIIRMNHHPHFTNLGIIKWCSAQLHENGHAVEEIEHVQKQYIGVGSAVMDNDEQVLLADKKYPQTKMLRQFAYDAYRARPSERLMRFVQTIFEDHMFNQLKQLRPSA